MARRERKKRSSISVDGDAVDKQMILYNCKGAADDKEISSSVTKKPQIQPTKDPSNVAAGPDLMPNNREPTIHVPGGKNVLVLKLGGGVPDVSLNLDIGASNFSLTIKMEAGGQGSGNRPVNLQFLQENQKSVPDNSGSTGRHFERSPKPSSTRSTRHASRDSHEHRRISLPCSEPHASKRRRESLPRSTRHPVHPDHDLQRKTDEKYYTCDGCKMPGFGTRYTCEQCSFKFNLHEKCTFSLEDSPGTQHYLFGKSTFKLLYKLPHGCHRLCEACAKPIKGFVYYCEEINSCVDPRGFHPRCFDLESKYSTEDEYKTEFELCPNQTFSKCLLCKKKWVKGSVTGNEGWTYVSKCKKFTVHVFCFMNWMVERRNEDLSLVKKNLKPPSGKNGNSIFEMACSFLEILLGVLLGDVISPALGLVQLLRALVQAQRKAIR